MRKILIDADACPVIDITIGIAQAYDVPVVLVCDTSHHFLREDVEILMADKGKDCTDFLLLRQVLRHDIVITQDYGLASLVLAKGGVALSQNGLVFHDDNMGQLLQSRHVHAMLRKHKTYGHIPKRCHDDDEAFRHALINVLQAFFKEET